MVIDTINFALITWGVPEKFRSYIDALIGASRGSTDWFEAADIEIGQRARPVSTTGLKEKSIERWTMRQRDEFAEWQQAYGVTLIETMPGGMKGGIKYKTRYKLENLFEIALEIAHRARSSRGYDTNPKRCMRKAAEAVYKEFKSRLNDPPKRQRFKNHYQDSETCLTVIRTYIEKYCGLAMLENKNLADGLSLISLLINEKMGMLVPHATQFHNGDKPTEFIYLPEISRVTPASTEIDSTGVAETTISNNPQTNSNDSRQPAREPQSTQEPDLVHSLSINRVYKPDEPDTATNCRSENDRDSALFLRDSHFLNAEVQSNNRDSLSRGESRNKQGAVEAVRAVAVFESVGCDRFEWFFVAG
ncbi:MAG: hypothetical protein J2P41_15980, partial [Blastocatellia bacterium]|nr:hypothetical protein [Blastocatellia bacterium]